MHKPLGKKIVLTSHTPSSEPKDLNVYSAFSISFCHNSYFVIALNNVITTLRYGSKWLQCTVVCWQLDILCRNVSGSAGNDSTVYIVNCVTLWLLYIGSWTVCAGVWVGQQEVTVLCALYIVWHYDCCILAVGQFVQECEWVRKKW
jgi:hypothetical protein